MQSFEKINMLNFSQLLGWLAKCRIIGGFTEKLANNFGMIIR